MKQKVKQWICAVLIILTVAFIFYNSAQPIPASQATSKSVAQTIAPITKNQYETPADWTSFVSMVRKGAHAVEFFVLGTELSFLFFVLRKSRNVQAIWNVLSVALAIAVADESVQILSGRGPKVQDVLLDFSGALCAIVLVWILSALCSAICSAIQQKKSVSTNKIGDGFPK